MKNNSKCILISKSTGKQYNFKSSRAASFFLGRTKSYVTGAVYRGLPIKHKETGEKFDCIFPERKPYKITRVKSEQPCWTCKKYCGGCSWSKNLTPVEGWAANPTTIHHEKGRIITSFEIISCPEYEWG